MVFMNYINRHLPAVRIVFAIVLLVVSAQYTAAQNVKGYVLDKNGDGIIGATVVVRGTTTGQSTGIEGDFEFSLPENIKYPLSLDVSYIGYEGKTVIVRNANEAKKEIVVTLYEEKNQLNDVVVIGYGHSLKKKLVGSVAKVKGDVIASHTEDSPILALQGNAAGAYVEQCSGVPGGANSTIVIRGYNALNTNRYNNMPMYVVDGVPLAYSEENPVSYIKEGVFETPDPLSLINPSDIESMEILKDADATAIYGTRGANGVIIITTKRGKSGKVKVNFSADATASWMGRRVDFCNTEEYLKLRREAFESDLKNGYVKESDWNSDNFPDVFLWDKDKDYDWQKELMGGTAWAENVQVSVSGGNRNTTFMVSGAYYNSSSVTKRDDRYTRWTGTANIQHHSDNNRFRIEAGVNLTNLVERANAAITAYAKLNTAPNNPPFDEKGNPYYIPDDQDYTSPMASRGFKGVNDVTNFMSNATVSYDFWNKLVGKVKLAYAFSGSHENNNYDKYYQNPYKDNPYSYGDYASLNTKTVSVEPQLTWEHDFFGGKATFLLGGTYEYNNTKAIALYEKDFSSDLFLRNAAAGNIITTHKNPETQSKTASVFGRVSYDYKDRYIGNVVLRRDGSSHFGRGRRWGTFYSLGGGWIFTNEKFVKESRTADWLSFGKLRMSFGRTGNENIGEYAYLTTYQVFADPYNGTLGLRPDNVGDNSLHWETVHKFDVGLELGFFSDRLLFSANYYCNTSSELLRSKKIASQVGYSSYTTNIDARVRNTGLELELDAKILNGRKWKWNSSLNMTFPKNRLIEYTDLENSADASNYVIGKSINLVKRYKYLGIDAETGIPQVQDTDKDGKISTADKIVMGDYDPDMYGGFNNTVSYGNFTLDISLYFRIKPYQSGFYNTFNKPAGMMYNVLRDYAQNHWSESNRNSKYPGITTTTGSPLYTAVNSYLSASDYGLSSGSYLRLSNVRLSYNLPKALLRGMGIDRASVYVQGKNLCYITDYDSYSIETGGSFIPPLGSFSFGINIGL